MSSYWAGVIMGLVIGALGGAVFVFALSLAFAARRGDDMMQEARERSEAQGMVGDVSGGGEVRSLRVVVDEEPNATTGADERL